MTLALRRRSRSTSAVCGKESDTPRPSRTAQQAECVSDARVGCQDLERRKEPCRSAACCLERCPGDLLPDRIEVGSRCAGKNISAHAYRLMRARAPRFPGFCASLIFAAAGGVDMRKRGGGARAALPGLLEGFSSVLTRRPGAGKNDMVPILLMPSISTPKHIMAKLAK